jgi:zinc protease
LPRKTPDFFPVLVLNAVLGGLFGSRINLNLREAHGYTYGASSYFDWRRGRGPFVVSTAVQSEVTAPALREILYEIDRIRAERIADDELSLARDYLEGVFPIRYETTAAIASALATLVIYELPDDYYDSYRRNVRAVSTEEVLRAAREHLHPDQLQTVVVGDARTVRQTVADLPLGDQIVHGA